MLFINGTKDKLFPVPGVKDAFAEMHKVWKSQGADNLLDTELWDIPHSCGLKAQEKMLEFLDKNLKKGLTEFTVIYSRLCDLVNQVQANFKLVILE